MYTKIQVTFDAAEPEKLAEFWGLALGYVTEPPPEGLVSEHVERLVQAGASLAWRTDDVRGSSVTLYDPEGNEFCVT
jgi:hypothetical protein